MSLTTPVFPLPFNGFNPPLHHAISPSANFRVKRNLSNGTPCKIKSAYADRLPPFQCPSVDLPTIKCMTSGKFTSLDEHYSFAFKSADEQEEILPLRSWWQDRPSCVDICKIIDDGSIATLYAKCGKDQCENFDLVQKQIEAAEEEMKKSGLEQTDDMFTAVCKMMGLIKYKEGELEKIKAHQEAVQAEIDTAVKAEKERNAGNLPPASTPEESDDTTSKAVQGSTGGSGASGLKIGGWKGMTVAFVVVLGVLGGGM